MTVTREIATTDWDEFLHVFSDRNQGRRVRLETVIRPGEGTPLLAEHQPLLGVDFEPKGSEAPAITVTVGGMDAAMPMLTHVIHAPRHLWAEEDANGLALALDIDSSSDGKTLLLFEPAEALPPAVGV
jgi:hypothetical protein